MLTPLANSIAGTGSFPVEVEPLGFPSVPTLLATRLHLEMLLTEQPVDLSVAAGIVLNDLGATLEIFRRAGEEAGAPCGSRMEDCLASLSTEMWMEAVCAEAVERTAGSSVHLAELAAFWEHARSVGCACWLLAQHVDSMCPEEAYLAGLLHEASQLPALLGWRSPSESAIISAPYNRAPWSEAIVATLTRHWQLPAAVRALVVSPLSSDRWRALLEAAHAWVDRAACLPLDTARVRSSSQRLSG